MLIWPTLSNHQCRETLWSKYPKSRERTLALANMIPRFRTSWKYLTTSLVPDTTWSLSAQAQSDSSTKLPSPRIRGRRSILTRWFQLKTRMLRWGAVLSFRQSSTTKSKLISTRALYSVPHLEDSRTPTTVWWEIQVTIKKLRSTKQRQEALIRQSQLLDSLFRKGIWELHRRIRKISAFKKRILLMALIQPNKDSLTWRKCKKWVKILGQEVTITCTITRLLLDLQWPLQPMPPWILFHPQVVEPFSTKDPQMAILVLELKATLQSSLRLVHQCSKILQAEKTSSTIFQKIVTIQMHWKTWGQELISSQNLHF